MARHARPSRAGAGRAAALVLTALALAALPGASATDYAGDYALYSGYHSGCAPVALGIEAPGFDVTGGEVDVTQEGVLYARFHVRTPDAYLPTRASADHATESTYYTMFVLGGDATSERGAGGFFGGYKVAGDGTDPTEGVLFFGVRGATAAEDVVLGEELTTTRVRGGLNGEATKVEFAFERAPDPHDPNLPPVFSLSIYADGQRVFEDSNVNMATSVALTSGPLAVGAGGHVPASSAFVDAFDAGGCFSPNLPGWTRDLARRPGEPAGELACGARNKWGERDGGDVLWCKTGWLGEPPGAAASAAVTTRAAFDPREHDCRVVAHARAAPMYSAAVPSAESEAWQRNNLPLGDETANYDGGHVNLRRLGMQPLDSRVASGDDWWGDAFLYARFRFTTPEHFDRPSEAWRIEAPDATRSGEAGKIRLMSLDQDVAASTDGSKVFKEGGVCVSLFPVFPDGRRFSSVRQHNNRSKVVLHACGESVPESNYELDHPDALLEPSTAYLLEIKFNFRKSSKSVQVFLQGELVDEAPFDHFPCKLNGGDADHKCWSKTDDIPHVVAFGDNSHHVDEFDWHGVEGFYDPLEFVGGGGVGAYRTSWGGAFSEPFNPQDDSCSRDGRCYRLTSPEGTWGEWTSGELHFCPYPSPLDPPRPPNVDVETFRAELACVSCYPQDESVGEALLGAVPGLDEMQEHGGVANDEIFRVLSATMGGADAKNAKGDPSPAGFIRMRGDALSDPNKVEFLFWTCEGASFGAGTLLMQAVMFSATNVSVSATSAGARKVAAGAGEAPACSGEETGWDVLQSWMSASAVASSPTAATGLNAARFGVHSIVAEVFVPAKVAPASATNNAWTLGWKTFEPVAARVSGNVSAGDATEYPFSVVHVFAHGEAESGDCPQAPAGRRRSLLRAPSLASSSSSAFSRFGAMSGSSPVPSGISRGASRSLLGHENSGTNPTTPTFPLDSDFCAAFVPKAICEGNGAKSFDTMCDTTNTAYGCSWGGSPLTCSMSSDDSADFATVLSGWFPLVDENSVCTSDGSCSSADGCFVENGSGTCVPIPSAGVDFLTTDHATAVIQTYYHSLRQSDYCMEVTNMTECPNQAGCYVVNENCQYAAEFGVWEVVMACEGSGFAFTPEEKDSIAVASFKSDWTSLLSFLNDNALDWASRYTIDTSTLGPSVPPSGSSGSFAYDPTCSTPLLARSDHTNGVVGVGVASSTPFSAGGVYYARFDMHHASDSGSSDQTLLLWGGDSSGEPCGAWHVGIKADGTMFMESKCAGPTGDQTSDSVSSTVALTDGAYYFLEFYYDSATSTARMWKLCYDFCAQGEPMGEAVEVTPTDGQVATLVLSDGPISVGYAAHDASVAAFAGLMVQMEVYDCPSGPSGPWPDLATFCEIYLPYAVCRGSDESACPTTVSTYMCTWDAQMGRCNMNSADHDALYGVYCNWVGLACGSSDRHNDYCELRSDQTACYQSSSLMGTMSSFLSGELGCLSLNAATECNNNQNCTWYQDPWSPSRCEPLVAAVNASMLSTGAHAAITEYAIADKLRYTCQTLDATTCSSVDGCEYQGYCNGPGSCYTNSQTACELDTNCVWSGCSSSSTYGTIQVATACGAVYSATDLDYIAQARGEDSWGALISGGGGGTTPPEDVDFCTAWVNVTACDVADAAGATSTNCPSSLCEFDDTSNPSTCTPMQASVDAWESEKSANVTSLLTACDSYDSTDCASASEGCFYNGVTCEPTPESALSAVTSGGGTAAMQTLAIMYTADDSGYCASLDSSACDVAKYCSWTGSACAVMPNLETALLGQACEQASDATVAERLTGVLSVLGHVDFTHYVETIMAPCDASAPPTNGGVGDCTSSLPSGSTCQPTCDAGYAASGLSSCGAGMLTAATCVAVPRDALAATCQYLEASPDLSSPATLVVVRLNVAKSTEGTSVTHVGTSVTENVADCHYASQDRDAVLAGWRCGVRVTDPDPFAVTGLLVREAPRAGASAPRAPLTGPELLSRRDFEGECECPECYERFGFANLRSVSDSAARTAALAAS